MRAWRQPQSHHPRLLVSEPRHRPTPIFPVKVCAPLYASHFGAILTQPRAPVARHNGIIQRTQRRKPRHCCPALLCPPHSAILRFVSQCLLPFFLVPSFPHSLVPSFPRSLYFESH